jgi:hypothetical protein
VLGSRRSTERPLLTFALYRVALAGIVARRLAADAPPRGEAL